MTLSVSKMCVKFTLVVYFSFSPQDANKEYRYIFSVIHCKVEIKGLCYLSCFQVVVGQKFIVPPFSKVSMLRKAVMRRSSNMLPGGIAYLLVPEIHIVILYSPII